MANTTIAAKLAAALRDFLEAVNAANKIRNGDFYYERKAAREALRAYDAAQADANGRPYVDCPECGHAFGVLAPAHLPARRKFKCDVCGRVDFWDEHWRQYSSLAHIDACPDDVPTVCSKPCREELDKRIAGGSVILPRLRATAGGFVVTKPRKGY